MEFWRKNRLWIVHLALCCALIAALALQNETIGGLRAQLEDSRQQIGALTRRLDAVDTRVENVRVTAEQASGDRPAPAVRFADPVLNTRDRMVTVEITAELPSEREHSLDIGFCRVGEPYRLAWKQDFLRTKGNGTYTATVTFPLELEEGLELRLEDDTVLFSGDPVLALLPLQMASGGTSWHYDSRDQVLYQNDFSIKLTDPAGQEVQPTDGEFRVYRNGPLVLRGRGRPDILGLEVEGELLDGVALPCSPGDRMRLCYACTDAFGLRYEFPISELLAMRWDDMERCPLSGRPTVTWPD